MLPQDLRLESVEFGREMSGEVNGEEIDDVKDSLGIEDRRIYEAGSKIELQRSDAVVELSGAKCEEKTGNGEEIMSSWRYETSLGLEDDFANECIPTWACCSRLTCMEIATSC